MVGERSHRSAAAARSTDRAEIHGLRTVVAASLAMAERLRSETATPLLRRALALIEDLEPEPETAARASRTFIPS